MSAPEPVLFHIQRGKALFFGLLWLAFTVVLAAALVKAIVLGELSVLGGAILTLLLTSFGPAAADYLWSFLYHPVAVCIDARGMSGHKFAAVQWRDIKEVTALRGRKRHRYLGITLHEPAAYLDGQSGLAQLRSKLWRWRYGQDIVVEGFLLSAGATEDIAEAAHTMRARS